jgi:hypothetical protein
MRPISLFLTFLLMAFAAAGASPAPPLLPPDARYKADMLIVVADPDDDVVVGGYLARLALDELKRIAVVYCTTGDGGGNAVGFPHRGESPGTGRRHGVLLNAAVPAKCSSPWPIVGPNAQDHVEASSARVGVLFASVTCIREAGEGPNSILCRPRCNSSDAGRDEIFCLF